MIPIGQRKDGYPAAEHIDNIARLGTPKRALAARPLNVALIRQALDRINFATGTAGRALDAADSVIIEHSLRAAEQAIALIRTELKPE